MKHGQQGNLTGQFLWNADDFTFGAVPRELDRVKKHLISKYTFGKRVETEGDFTRVMRNQRNVECSLIKKTTFWETCELSIWPVDVGLVTLLLGTASRRIAILFFFQEILHSALTSHCAGGGTTPKERASCMDGARH